MKVFKVLLGVALVVGTLAIGAAGLSGRPPPAVQVQLSEARRGTITRTVAGAGKVQPATTVKISSSLSSELTELLVKEGDRVARGQVLGRLDRRRFEASARQFEALQNGARADIQLAQVEVDRAGAELARVEGLHGKGMSPLAEVERARADREAASARLASARQRLEQAKAQLEEARTNLSKTVLTSPIEGTVIELSREVGERVRGSDLSEDVVMTVAALSAMEVKIEVSEHEVVHLTPGQPAEVRIDALEGQGFAATVSEIAQRALIRNEGTETEVTSFPVTAVLTSHPPGVLPGMSAEVRIAAKTREGAVLIPLQAVTVRPERVLSDTKHIEDAERGPRASGPKLDMLTKVVFVLEPDDVVQPRRVRTGISSETEVEILDGLKEGERVVEGPYRTLAKDLKAGDRVKQMAQDGAGGASARKG